jgi:hypothetical protein
MKQRAAVLVARWALGGIVREIAEGKRGPRAKAVYWALAGHKRESAAILGLIFAALVTFEPATAAHIAPTATAVLGLLVAWGLVDSEWRKSTLPSEWSDELQQLLSYGPAISALVALVVEYLPQIPSCDWCAPLAFKLQLVAAAVATATAWLAARMAPPPAVER